MSSVSNYLTKGIISTPFKLDKERSISPACYIPMIAHMKAKNSDWSNNISSYRPLFRMYWGGLKKERGFGNSCLILWPFSLTIRILLWQLSNCSGLWLTRKELNIKKHLRSFIRSFHIPIIQFSQKPWRNGMFH